MRELWVVCVFYMQKIKVNNDMGLGLDFALCGYLNSKITICKVIFQPIRASSSNNSIVFLNN